MLAASFLLATTIDPYVDLHRPAPILAFNALVPLVLMLLAWGVSGRAWIGLLVEALVLAALRYVNLTKVAYLNTDLVYADFIVLRGLARDPRLILGFVRPGLALPVGLLSLIVSGGVLAWLTRRLRPLTWPARLACVGVSAAMVIVAASCPMPPTIPAALGWDVYGQAIGAHQVGITGNLLLGAMTSSDVQRQPDPAMEQAFWREPTVQAFKRTIEARTTGQRPDVVVVQSESLFMPSQLCGFSDTPVLHRIVAGDAGFLRVPVFGGRTLQTEFEVQSGAPISFFPGSMFAYYELLHQRVDAWPHFMDELGYKTQVIHPNARGFWNRDAAMPQLGFATFQDRGSFMPGDHADHGSVSDLAVTRAILSELDAADRPTYITAITIDNHGPWGDHAPEDDSDLGLPDTLHGEARTQMADYIARARDADKAFGYLIDALQRRGRPTIVVLYGDHLPALEPVYDQLCFKDGESAQAHMPPYRVWANFPVEAPPPELPAYLLQGYIMRQAGVPLSGHLLANAIAGLVFTDAQLAPLEQKRILDEYAHIAAANLQRDAGRVDPDRGTVFIGRQAAWKALQRLSSSKAAIGRSETRNGDLYLVPDASGTAVIDFHLGHELASLTLRPYMQCSDAQATPMATLRGDGRLLYRASIGPDLLRLVTLDLRGIDRLTLEVAHLDGVCGAFVRVAQLLRCRGACPAVPGDIAAGPSRIVANDPTAADQLALAAILSPAQRHEADRRSNLQWLLARESDRQDGAVPITVQSDDQLFMHPAEDHDAWIQFDRLGLDAVELTPKINALDRQCLSYPEPGTVALNVLVDGKPVVQGLRIDRNYDQLLHVDLRGATTLRLDVDKGEGGNVCDWFSIGVEHLQLHRSTSAATE
jgi:hypothetical protein